MQVLANYCSFGGVGGVGGAEQQLVYEQCTVVQKFSISRWQSGCHTILPVVRPKWWTLSSRCQRQTDDAGGGDRGDGIISETLVCGDLVNRGQ